MRILLVEDDEKAARLLARGFREEGFVVDIVSSAEEGDEQAFVTDYELIILDWMLPGRDGLSLCRDLRQRGAQAPILMLTARDALADRVTGLNAGADDYLTKPFAFEELLARARALLRRSELTRPALLTIDDLTVDPLTHKVTRGTRSLELTRKEFSILELLMRRPGEVVSRTRLAEQVWQADVQSIDNLIDVHVSNLRRKIDASGATPLLHTVRGRGFRIAVRE
jgi:DNA-binding response OmpR family regulator